MSRKSRVRDTAVLILSGVTFRGVYHERATGYVVSRRHAGHLFIVGDAVRDPRGQALLDHDRGS